MYKLVDVSISLMMITFCLTIASLCMLGIAAIVLSATADGKVNYCYVEYRAGDEYRPPSFGARGHRAWRQDRKLGLYSSHEAAVGAMRELGCEVR